MFRRRGAVDRSSRGDKHLDVNFDPLGEPGAGGAQRGGPARLLLAEAGERLFSACPTD